MADFILGRLKFKWQGAWTASTAYIVDDVVNYSGTSWVCVENHTSTNSFVDDRDDSKWQVIARGFNYRNSWSSVTTYEINDIVEHDGSTWVSLQDSNVNQTPSPSSASYWNLLAEGVLELTTKGDLLYRNTTSNDRLAIGTENQTLQVSASGVPEWVSNVDIPGTLNVTGNKIALTGKLYQGPSAEAQSITDGLTGLNVYFVADEDGFSQVASKNISNDTLASTDFIAYADNGDNDTGWIDMGITSSTFDDPAFGVTGINDGYIFMSAPDGTTGNGNLYISTSGNGVENDIVFSTGGFEDSSYERMRIVGTAHGMYNAGINLMDDVSTTNGNFYVGPNAKALTVDNVGSGYVGLTNATAIFTGNANDFVQFALKNTATGASASTDMIAYASNGDNDSGWIDMGITSENYSDPAFTVTGPDTGYIFMSAKAGTSGSGNLLIGTDETGTDNDIVFFTNGFDAGNERVRIIGTGVNAGVEIYADTESTTTTTGALRVSGGIGLLGNLNVGGDVNIVGNITLGGTGNTVETESLAVADPIIRMANGNTTSDALDIGFVGTYASSGTKYTGLVRDATDGIYKLFTGMTANPTTTVDFTGATYGSLKAGSLELTTALPIASGGTGASTASDAINALVPTQSTNAGKFLTTNGTTVSWSAVDAYPSQSGNAGKFLTTNGTTVSWAEAAQTVSDDTSTNSSFYVQFTSSTSGTITTTKVSSTKLTFNPNSGTLTSTILTSSSDARLKENVKPLTNALDKVLQLEGVEFNRIGSTNKEIGLIAQKVELTVPELVHTGDDGMKSVAYSNTVALLIEAIKEQQAQIEELKKRLA